MVESGERVETDCSDIASKRSRTWSRVADFVGLCNAETERAQ